MTENEAIAWTREHVDAGSFERIAHQRRRDEQRARLHDRLAAERTASDVAAAGGTVSQDGARRPAWEWLRFDGVDLAALMPDAAEGIDAGVVAETVEDARYAPYLERQADEIARRRADEALLLPDALDYAAVPGLSNEMIDRLGTVRPTSLGAASRVRGVTPAALSAVLLHARKMAA